MKKITIGGTVFFGYSCSTSGIFIWHNEDGPAVLWNTGKKDWY